MTQMQFIADPMLFILVVGAGVLAGNFTILLWSIYEDSSVERKVHIKKWLKVAAFGALSALSGYKLYKLIDTGIYSIAWAMEVISPTVLLLGVWGLWRALKS